MVGTEASAENHLSFRQTLSTERFNLRAIRYLRVSRNLRGRTRTSARQIIFTYTSAAVQVLRLLLSVSAVVKRRGVRRYKTSAYSTLGWHRSCCGWSRKSYRHLQTMSFFASSSTRPPLSNDDEWRREAPQLHINSRKHVGIVCAWSDDVLCSL